MARTTFGDRLKALGRRIQRLNPFAAPRPTFRQTFVRITRNIIASHWRRFAVSFLVGLGILFAMRVPFVDRSMLGQLDREMMQMAFKIRADLVFGGGDPVLFIDVDDGTVSQGVASAAGGWPAPPVTAPRGVMASVLEFIRTAPPGEAPKAVMVDVDLATPIPGDEANVARLRNVLSAWAQTPSAPLLILARESFPQRVLGGQGNTLVLPNTPYDDIVGPAGNITWAQVKMLGDQDGIVREFLPYECIQTAQGMVPLYSAVLWSYRALEGGSIPHDAAIVRWLEQADADCAAGQPHPFTHGELINYHLSLNRGGEDRVWPDIPRTWPGYARCGADSDTSLFRRLSAADVAAAAGSDASHALLCQRLVVLGGTNMVASDFQQTPLDDMAGPMVLVNAIRGLQMSNGGLRRVPTWLQILTLFVVSGAMSGGFLVTKRIRDHYLNLRTKYRERPMLVRLSLMPFNPLVLNWLFAFAAHWTGVALLLVSLDHGYWGYLSAPAFAAAATGAMQEFADDEESA